MHDLITVAPAGARRSKLDHPALPITLGEIIETARACYTAGAEPEYALLAFFPVGRIRIGLENNFRKSNGMTYTSTAESIAHVAALATTQGYLAKQLESAT